MEYDFNQLADPRRFQRLVNTFLVARFGEDARLTPLQGPDGGSDGETASSNPFMEFRLGNRPPSSSDLFSLPPRPGRYLFQAKYHRTGEPRLSDLRSRVIQEFSSELKTAVLDRPDRADVNYFILVTNVSASKDAIQKTDDAVKRLLAKRPLLHADIWWAERIVAILDRSPDLWLTFPELFPGGVPPFLAQAIGKSAERLPRTLRLAVRRQHENDLTVKFRQVELEKQLVELFVDLDVDYRAEGGAPFVGVAAGRVPRSSHDLGIRGRADPASALLRLPDTALEVLIDDNLGLPRILLEGGPGQGKSTVTQMAAQIYRQKLLGNESYARRAPKWFQMIKPRLPLRLELRHFAGWLSEVGRGTLEQYVAHVVGGDAGGVSLAVEDVHSLVERSSVILLLDGLDEIGKDALRNSVLDEVMEAIDRFEEDLKVDLRVVLTSRPPALAGRRDQLSGFNRVLLAPMSSTRMDDYLERWLGAQVRTDTDRLRIRTSFQARRSEPHVEALARNPMQLSVLLQLIYLQGEAFPDRRADLYGEYFKTVIDRDVEKSPELRESRELVEGLHAFLGFRLHGATELGEGRTTRDRKQILELAGGWLRKQGHPESMAGHFFALGEERFGLIVTVSGQGDLANYGFEVQPIQEYFAASYISNHLEDGRAHEVFELLLHRSYWREVGLFLAGLRRPNEKADLIARARAADEEAERGWRQDGRSMVLQLLREGVFQQPPHLLKDAMDFVVDLLDVKAVRVQKTPEGLVDTICQVGGLYPNDGLRRRIVRLVERYRGSEDEHEIASLHRVAARLLSTEQYTKLVSGYQGTEANAVSVVRMDCPHEAPMSLEVLARRKGYWDGVAVSTWARRLWRASLRHATVVDVDYPPRMHEALVVAFATNYPVGRGEGEPAVAFRGTRPPAVWRLQQNLQVLHQASSAREGGGTAKQLSSVATWTGVGASHREGPATYEHLPAETEGCLKDLIETSDGVLGAVIGADERDLVRELGLYLQAIEGYLREPGLPGWVACRCALEILRLAPTVPLADQKEGLVLSIQEALVDFFEVKDIRLPLRYLIESSWFSLPERVRLTRGAGTLPVGEVMADHLDGRLGNEEQASWRWIGDIPFSGGVIKWLVETNRSTTAMLLKSIGERPVAGPRFWPRLRVQDTQRVLKICRRTEDQEVLKGAATVLSYAMFTRIAEPSLVARILSASPGSGLVTRVLGRRGKYFPVRGAERRRRERELSLAVAALVLEEPEQYPFRVVSEAAALVAETDTGSSNALFEDCPDLA